MRDGTDWRGELMENWTGPVLAGWVGWLLGGVGGVSAGSSFKNICVETFLKFENGYYMDQSITSASCHSTEKWVTQG